MVLTYGVTVTQQILVLLFEVRILIGQQKVNTQLGREKNSGLFYYKNYLI